MKGGVSSRLASYSAKRRHRNQKTVAMAVHHVPFCLRSRSSAISDTRNPQQHANRKTVQFIRALQDFAPFRNRSHRTAVSSRRVRIRTGSTFHPECLILSHGRRRMAESVRFADAWLWTWRGGGKAKNRATWYEMGRCFGTLVGSLELVDDMLRREVAKYFLAYSISVRLRRYVWRLYGQQQ